RVLAYVNGAWGTPSSAVSAIPTSAVPQNVSVINGDGKVTISWSNVSGATKYRLQRTTGSAWSTIVYPSATSYTDTSVTNGTTYKYRVLAYVNGAWSTPSDYATATPDEKL
ncbi:MAG: fibronectin type III domain-containing protein, partial [Ruminiclostridium sp.]|nr:fibronectin type III domain-containing protein [Ruminiclostridium sp.]